MIDFLLLSKMDFEEESKLKKKLFGKPFGNIDCPTLTRCNFRAIMLSQMFNDDFVFVEKGDEMPSSRLASNNPYEF